MSQNVPNTFVTLFENNMRLALNQTRAKIWPLLPTSTGAGSEKKQLDDIIGQVKSRRGGARHGDVEYANTEHSRVWVVKPEEHYYAELIDRNDQVQAAIQLQSGYMQTAVATINRAKDDEFLAGFFGNMITGKGGTTLSPFPSGNVIPASTGSTAACGLNIAKLRAARKLRAEQHNDMALPAHMLVTADDLDQLLNELPVTSKEFGAEGGELRDGKLRRLMGFTFHEVETENPLFHNASAVDAGSGNRKTPFWTQGGVVAVPWWDLYTSIKPLPQKKDAIQIYADFCGAVTRVDNAMVGYIENKTY